jgi:hypothetical protein
MTGVRAGPLFLTGNYILALLLLFDGFLFSISGSLLGKKLNTINKIAKKMFLCGKISQERVSITAYRAKLTYFFSDTPTKVINTINNENIPV